LLVRLVVSKNIDPAALEVLVGAGGNHVCFLAAVEGEDRVGLGGVASVVGSGVAGAFGSAHVLVDESHHASINR